MSASRRVEVLGGAGTVCRRGAVVVWLPAGFSSVLATELLEAALTAAATGGGDGLVAALESYGSRSAGFGVVVETEEGLSVALHGRVVLSEDGLERLRGGESTSLVSAEIATTSSVTLRGATDPDQLDRPGSLPFDLRDGAVPGGGVTFWPSGWSSGHQQSATPPALDDRVVLFDLSVSEVQREPLPLASTPASAVRVEDGPMEAGTEPAVLSAEAVAATEAVAAAVAPTPVAAHSEPPPKAATTDAGVSLGPEQAVSLRHQVVTGINCARGHFNNPNALYCGICGLAMVQNSVIAVEGRRPPLGVLLLDDGTAYSLDGDYILGRGPDTAEDVASGRARPLTVDDGSGRISRVHARVTLNAWDVVITDLGSHNGTTVFNPRDTSWRTLGANESVVLQPGGRLVVGQRTFEFQSIQR